MAKIPAEAFPLCWPEGWKRTRNPEHSRFKTGFGAARNFLAEELKRMGATGVILSSNVALRNDGEPRANQPEPKDTGIAGYFKWKGRDFVIPCDKFRYTRDNIYAIAKTIQAMRGIERWGAGQMMERAFAGFKALEASTAKPWRTVMDLPDDYPAVKAVIEEQYRKLARQRHPDNLQTGSHEAMQELNTARAEGLLEAGQS